MTIPDAHLPLPSCSPYSATRGKCEGLLRCDRSRWPSMNRLHEHYLPLDDDSCGIRGEKTSLLAVHTANKRADAERTTTTSLCVSTLNTREKCKQLLLATHVVRYILYRGNLIEGHAITLSFHARLDWTQRNKSTISTSFLASALKPVNRKVMFSSIFSSFLTVRES